MPCYWLTIYYVKLYNDMFADFSHELIPKSAAEICRRGRFWTSFSVPSLNL